MELWIAAKIIGLAVGAILMTTYLASRQKPGAPTEQSRRQ